MNPDAEVCLCFHVTRRKLESFLRVERPRVASQLSQCGGAGTGCGWCVPYLKQMFQRTAGAPTDLDELTAEEYGRGRAEHIRAGKGTPPPGAAPLPPCETDEGR
jgi:NAD(P)H-nitrite reductase large subunit